MTTSRIINGWTGEEVGPDQAILMQPRHVTGGESFTAGFLRENTAIAIYDWVTRDTATEEGREIPFYLPDDRDQIIGYEDHDEEFAFAENMADVTYTKQQIDRERKMIEDAYYGGAMGIMGMLSGALIDPANFLGAAWAGKQIIRHGASALRLRLAAEMIGTNVASEAVLQATFATRDAEETAYALAGAFFLAGFIPVRGVRPRSLPNPKVTARELKKVGRKPEEMAAAVEKDLTIPKAGDPDTALPEQVPITLRDFEADLADGGSRRSSKIQDFYGKKHMQKMLGGMSINSRMWDTRSATASDTVAQLLEQPLRVEGRSYVALETVKRSEIANRHARTISAIGRHWLKSLGVAAEGEGALGMQVPKKIISQQIRAIGRGVKNMALDMEPPKNMDELVEKLTDQGDELSFRAFHKEASRAAHYGEIDPRTTKPFPEDVAGAGKEMRKFYDYYQKRLTALGYDVSRLPNYVNRVWLRKVLIAHKPEALEIFANHVQKRHGDWSAEKIELWAEKIWTHLTTGSRAHLEVDGLHVPVGAPKMGGTQAAPLQTREFKITMEEIDGTHGGPSFIELDAEVLIDAYHRSAVPDLLIMEKFGIQQGTDIDTIDKMLAKKFEGIRNEYRKLIDEAEDEAGRLDLSKHMERDIVDVQAGFDLFRHRHNLPSDETAVVTRRVFRALRNYSTSTYGGGMSLASVTDLGKLIFGHGVGNLMDDILVPMASDWKQFKVSLEQAGEISFAAETVLSSRTAAFSDYDEAISAANRAERAIDNTAKGVMLASGMNIWNSLAKRLASLMSQAEMLRAARQLESTGKLTKSMRGMMDRLALDDDSLREIQRRFGSGAGDDIIPPGAPISFIEHWPDDALTLRFRAAVSKDVNTMIVTPSIGDLPIVMQTNDFWRAVMQFKSFGVASLQRTTYLGLQEGEWRNLHGVLAMTALGYMVYSAKELGKPEKHRWRQKGDPAALAWEMIDRSGAFAPFTDVNNTLSKISGGRLAVQRLFGAQTMGSRAARPNVLGALLGPTAGQTMKFATILGGATDFVSGEPLSDFQKSQMRRVAPWESLFYYRWLMNNVSQSNNPDFGGL